jgi:RHS repeat-associated protein
VSRQVNGPYDSFEVQLNTGTNFLDPVEWGPLNSQGDTTVDWNKLYSSSHDNLGYSWFTILFADMNGDGLPDRVMRMHDTPYTNFVVQFNNGAGFDTNLVYWGPVDTRGYPNDKLYGSPTVQYSPPSQTGNSYSESLAQLVDVNGDGLPDRLFWDGIASICQLNTGNGFGPTNSIPLLLQEQYDGGLVDELFDINGDGLPDFVSTPFNRSSSTNARSWTVRLAAGPYPDLLNCVSNGLGGAVKISYLPSTQWNNRDKDWVNDPLAEGTKSLLPSVVYTVSQTRTFDGMGNVSTNTYFYKGGYFNSKNREFRGFAEAHVKDPLGTEVVTYFHQSGGRDNSALGEYLDQGSASKMGIAYRIDVFGTNGLKNSTTLNKVEEVLLHTNGWYFPFTSQTITMNYEGLANYRAAARQFYYDTNNGNLIEEASLGEVTGIVLTNQSCVTGDNHAYYTWTSYASIGNILDLPSDVKITSDSGGVNRLRETLLFYDARGNLTNSQAWLDTAGAFINTKSMSYDNLGNLATSTDAVGITTTVTYESTFGQFPSTSTTGSFVTSSTYDPGSGLAITSTDPKGLVTSNSFDAFFRNTGTYISTNANGAPTLWKARTDYTLGGVSGGVSSNCVHKQENDGIDAVNGHETFTYTDGLGHLLQSRAEAENGHFRVVSYSYDLRGNKCFMTEPYFNGGTNFTPLSGTNLGSYFEYDEIGRNLRTTPAAEGVFVSNILSYSFPTGGDSGSPNGPISTVSVDGTNPWVKVTVDPQGQIQRSFSDAFGRYTNIVIATTNGSFAITNFYDLFGNVTNVEDMMGHSVLDQYDSLNRQIRTVDPDLGTWNYVYDNAGRLIQQIDAKTNKQVLTYSDEIGRLTAKQIYNSSNALVETYNYLYDSSQNDTNYTVFKGQVYEVTDAQGYERYSYDLRGRTIKSGRFLAINAMEYVMQSSYNDADRLQTLTYPGNAATIQYSYDDGGNISRVESLGGTGGPVVFYNANAFDEIGHLINYTDGGGCVTSNSYFPNSKRLARTQAFKGTNALQDIAYTYDMAANVLSVTDNAYVTNRSASYSSISYDGLYRLTSLNSTARGTSFFSYDSIGNILTNSDLGSGSYTYGLQPHAVTNANGALYQYDACGNMIARGNQTLAYDAQNRLVAVSSASNDVRFGYDGTGARLWRSGTNGYTIWIGGNYEINSGRILCHVTAGNLLIASFEPSCTAGLNASNAVFYYYHPDNLGSATVLTDTNGNRVQHYGYTAFGFSAFTDNATAFPISKRYTGQVADDETGLYYYNSRYYDPQLGRFTQPDTIIPNLGDPQSYNRYSYVQNNPLTYTDPSGHELKLWDWIGTIVGNSTERPQNVPPTVPKSAALTQAGMRPIWLDTTENLVPAAAKEGVKVTGGLAEEAVKQEVGGRVIEGGLGVAGATVKALSREATPALKVVEETVPGMKIKTNPKTSELGGINFSGANSEAAELKPYGGKGGGHHVPAKSAMEGAAGYDANKALAVPNAEMARLKVDHGLVSGAQQTLYRAFAKTGAPLTWEAVAEIEAKALVRGGLTQARAEATVAKAIEGLKAMGVPGPTRIPWAK